MRAALTCFLLLLFFSFSVSAETIIFVSEKDYKSKSIQSILNGVKRHSGTALIAPVSDLNNYTKFSDGKDDKFILVGAELVGQSDIIPDGIPVIGAGFYLPPVPTLKIDTLSLYPDIDTIFSEITKTGFPLKRIRTIVSTKTLKAKLESVSPDSEYEITVELADGERETARAWFELLRDINPASDVLLISDSSFLDSSGSYRSILETAWRRNILVVSALPQYSTRGVSIGFIPDLISYGESLAESLDALVTPNLGNNVNSSDLTTDVLVRVFNERTLSHVGYSLPGDLDRLMRDDMVIE